VLTTIDTVLPPLPAVLARAQAFLSTEAFPAAFAAITPPRTSSVALPTPLGAAAIAAPVAGSVDKVLASGGCSETREATSFVVAPGLVATNAHVVAGESRVDVVTSAGSVASTVVLFDPQLDVAILRVPGLTSRPVALDTQPAPVGTRAAVVGFPENGARTARPAGVAQSFLAQGRDIYGGSLVTRPIYAVTATVLPGNSGSPLVAGGRAIGMVFSRSLAQNDLAYAIQASALAPEVQQARVSQAAVSTGACTPN
jgi:S1-C subfamily serine protease